MSELLDVTQPIMYDNSIAREEWHFYQPYVATTFNNSDEIRIPILQQDIYTLPSKSCIHIQGRLTKADGSNPPADTKISKNGFAFLFDEIRYILNGVEIERNKFVGTCSTMKAYVSLNETHNGILENAGWNIKSNILDEHGYFNVFLPLNLILGFAEDYQKILMNSKQELVLIRARNDVNAYISNDELKFTLTKVEWYIPHIITDDQEKLKLLHILNSKKNLQMAFRSWDIYEFPLLPVTKKHIWAVKASTQLEKPRFIIIGFQTNRKNKKDKDASEFDHCNLSDIKLFLNSVFYPYQNLNLDLDKNKYAVLYDMYLGFQKSYYGRNNGSFLNKNDFLSIAPLVVIDCSHQNESVKSGTVDIKIEFETKENIPAGTSAYCLVLHDRIVEYNPMTGIVQTVV